MLKRLSLFLLAPLFLTGCAATLTNLTPTEQARNAQDLYPVEVAFASRQQTLRWETIKAKLVLGDRTFDMVPTQLMSNRWEGLLQVPPGEKSITYRYQLDYLYNTFGKPKVGSAVSSEYTLHIKPR